MEADKRKFAATALLLLELDLDSQQDEDNLNLCLSSCTTARSFVGGLHFHHQTCHRVRIPEFVSRVVPGYSDDLFQRHFRVSRDTKDELCRVLHQKLSVDEHHGGRIAVSPEKHILMSLWMLGNTEPYRSVADRFGVSESTLLGSFDQVTNYLADMSQERIRWPTGSTLTKYEEDFCQMGRIPGVIGCVDGSHIPIPAPTTNSVDYINRKNFSSLNIQITAGPDLMITSAFCGYPGSVHDARVLRNSNLFKVAEDDSRSLFPRDTHLLGDSAYPLKTWLLPPYRDNGHLTASQKKFNLSLAKTRQVVERTIGLLKGRWRKLKNLEMRRVHRMPTVIVAACVLHNICISRGEINEREEDCHTYQATIGDVLVQEGPRTPAAAAVEKRNTIAESL